MQPASDGLYLCKIVLPNGDGTHGLCKFYHNGRRWVCIGHPEARCVAWTDLPPLPKWEI